MSETTIAGKYFVGKAAWASYLNKVLRETERRLGTYKSMRGWHGLRKSFAETLFESNRSLPVTRRLMRHKSIETTIKHYNHYEQKELLAELETAQNNVRKMSVTTPKRRPKTP